MTQTIPVIKPYVFDSWGETIDFAGSLGWIDESDSLDELEEDWNPVIADGLLEDAIDHIKSKGYTVIIKDWKWINL